ncbi:MAG: FAD-dependent oxidoreductase [Deltaproteobacteria bacterium]
MTEIATPASPVRVAIIGSGPAGFYAADPLLKQTSYQFEVDMYDRLPTPYGLVRCGVAPDHQKIKSVTRVYEKIAAHPKFRFFGYVEFGAHITLEDLKRHYHIIIFATGAQTDKRMNIPGEDLLGSHPATEFVAWYNGHPDYCHLNFDLSQERVAVIGVGNVAIDVARILCLNGEELKKTDIADYALHALANSRVKEVYIVGRRGPAQAAFTNPEIKEVGNLADANALTLPEEVALDEATIKSIETDEDKATITRKVEILTGYSVQRDSAKSKRLYMRFLLSPVEIIGDAGGRVSSIRLVRNALYADKDGSLKARATDKFEEIPAGLVFRSIGYYGIGLPGVPFNDKWGVILNDKGRILDPDTKKHALGLYTTGWIKRGPTGVIGTNKTDSAETVARILEDVAAGNLPNPSLPEARAAERLIMERQPSYVTYKDWLSVDKKEIARGQAEGRPRVKFTNIEDIMSAVDR